MIIKWLVFMTSEICENYFENRKQKKKNKHFEKRKWQRKQRAILDGQLD